MMVRRTSVIVVTYNSERSVASALSPLLATAEIELVVVDNASTDGTGLILTQLLGPNGWISNSANIGFARAVNLGVRASQGDVLVLLNPDAEASLATVLALTDSIRGGGAKVVAPLVSTSRSASRLISAGRFPTVWRMFCHYSGLSRLSPHFRPLEGHYFTAANLGLQPREVDWVTGACIAVGRGTWESLGGLTEKWFMYGEDVDFCIRVKRQGGTVVIRPDLACQHAVAGSQPPNVINRIWIENLADLYYENYARTPVHMLAWGLVVFVGMEARAGAMAVRGQSDDAVLARRRFHAYARAGLKRAWLLATLRNRRHTHA